MLTIEPVAEALPRSLESVCRKFVNEALLPEPPRELTRFWKFCCSESRVSLEAPVVDEAEAELEAELELVDESWEIRLCTSLCIWPP